MALSNSCDKQYESSAQLHFALLPPFLAFFRVWPFIVDQGSEVNDSAIQDLVERRLAKVGGQRTPKER